MLRSKLHGEDLGRNNRNPGKKSREFLGFDPELIHQVQEVAVATDNDGGSGCHSQIDIRRVVGINRVGINRMNVNRWHRPDQSSNGVLPIVKTRRR